MEKGKVLGLPVKENWLYVHVSLYFTSAQETQERLFSISSTGLVCLFLSDLSYGLTSVCGKGLKSDFCA